MICSRKSKFNFLIQSFSTLTYTPTSWNPTSKLKQHQCTTTFPQATPRSAEKCKRMVIDCRSHCRSIVTLGSLISTNSSMPLSQPAAGPLEIPDAHKDGRRWKLRILQFHGVFVPPRITGPLVRVNEKLPRESHATHRSSLGIGFF